MGCQSTCLRKGHRNCIGSLNIYRKQGLQIMHIHSKWHSLMGCIAILLILVFWHFTYESFCWAWVFVIFILAPILYGQFEYFVQYRKCRANCLFEKNSWLYCWLTKRPLIFIRSLLIATPLALAVMSFVALATGMDVWFIMLATAMTLTLYPILLKVLQKHVTQSMLDIISKRFVVVITMIAMLLIYSVFSYFSISVPAYLDPTSLENTVNEASQGVGSVCPTTNYFLKFMREVDAAGWYSMLIANRSIQNEPSIFLLWLLFFIHHAFVFAGFSRAQVEVMSRIKQLSTSGDHDEK